MYIVALSFLAAFRIRYIIWVHRAHIMYLYLYLYVTMYDVPIPMIHDVIIIIIIYILSVVFFFIPSNNTPSHTREPRKKRRDVVQIHAAVYTHYRYILSIFCVIYKRKKSISTGELSSPYLI